jgi:hypothetical protein
MTLRGLSIEYESSRDLHGFEMDVVPSVLNPSGQAVNEVVAPMSINVVGLQLTIGLMARAHVKRTDDDGMGHCCDRPLLAPTSQALGHGDRDFPLVRAAAWGIGVRPVRRV